MSDHEDEGSPPLTPPSSPLPNRRYLGSESTESTQQTNNSNSANLATISTANTEETEEIVDQDMSENTMETQEYNNTANQRPSTPRTPTTPPMPRTPQTPQTPQTPSSPGYNNLPPLDRRRPMTPPTPPSPTSAVSISASAVSATEQHRYGFSEMSASIDATPMPRYLGHGYGGQGVHQEEDDVEAELRRMAQRQLPRGDLGRNEWRLDRDSSFTQEAWSHQGPPSSPTGSIRSNASVPEPIIPRAPPSPPSSPSSSRSVSNRSSVSVSNRLMTSSQTEQDFTGAVIWGTNISVQESMGLFREFLHEFQPEEQVENHFGQPQHQEEGYYLKVLRHLHLTQGFLFNLDCQHLLFYRRTRKIYHQLVLFPQVLIRLLDMVVAEEMVHLFSNSSSSSNNNNNNPEEEDSSNRNNSRVSIQVRPYNLKELQPMRQLNPCDIDQLVCLKGMITRCSNLIPDLKEAFFKCSICLATKMVELDRGRIEEPTFCMRCQTRFSMEMIHNRCIFTDKQMIKMQETPDAIPEGETPYTVMLFAFDDLVDEIRPGDKVEVTGIYRAVPIRTSYKQRVVKSVFKTYIDVVHFRKVDELTRGQQQDGEQQQEEDNLNQLETREQARIEEFYRIANHPNVYENLAHSFAPSIWELDDVKKGILCQLFGGTRKEKTTTTTLSKSNHVNVQMTRSDINILLCGDPGTSKSQLLSYVHKLSPRSIYTSGKGSSAVGLTASVLRDMETGDLVLESGALVLSDQGICCIDEFDKMSDSARSVLHEVMEQQTVSIAKAGIICSLNARASILASANPIESRYNPKKSVIENVNILPTLLSRFDLIYLILDKPVAETDRKLAKHIVALYFDDHLRQDATTDDPTSSTSTSTSGRPQRISMKLLTQYISFAKKKIHPKLSMEAKKALIQAYLDLRRMGSLHSSKKNITATPRQLESLIRLSEALARMKLSEQVTQKDVEEALRLMNVATQRAAMDPRTGTIDMDMINTGHSTLEREAIADLIELMKLILNETPYGTMGIGELRRIIEEKKQTEIKGSEFQMALRSLEDDEIIQLSHGTIRYYGNNQVP